MAKNTDAVFVNTKEGLTFRLGQPTSWGKAINRWNYVDSKMRNRRIRFNRRWYHVYTFEVRSVDRHGRGIGADRHAGAIPIPYRALVSK